MAVVRFHLPVAGEGRAQGVRGMGPPFFMVLKHCSIIEMPVKSDLQPLSMSSQSPVKKEVFNIKVLQVEG